MRHFGLIGYPLEHSFSKSYFAEKFKKENIEDCSYGLFPLRMITDFSSLINNNKELYGLNVTIPYKTEVLPYLDELDDPAKEIGAVNTIKITREDTGKALLKGYNTDALGFEGSIKPYLNTSYKKALILGTGGASKAILYVLANLGIACQLVSLKPSAGQIGYDQITIDVMHEHQLIVNCTPLGMYPNVETHPQIPYELLSKDHFLYDMVYNPEETEFLKKGKANEAKVINGLEMLHIQAERSWEIWNS